MKWGEDLIQQVYAWNPITDGYDLANGTSASQIGRLCSADLPAPGAFYNPATGKGFADRIFTSGEETGDEGRSFARIVTGPYKGTFVASCPTPAGSRGKHRRARRATRGDNATRVRDGAVDDQNVTPGRQRLGLYRRHEARPGATRSRWPACIRRTALFGVTVDSTPFENSGPINGDFVLTDVSQGQPAAARPCTTRKSEPRPLIRVRHGPEGRHTGHTQDPRVFYFVTTGGHRERQHDQTARLATKLTLEAA